MTIMDAFGGIGGALWGLAMVGLSVAAIIRELYRGRATLIRARRGDPEPPTQRPAVPAIFNKRS
jgi:hypothetical protein